MLFPKIFVLLNQSIEIKKYFYHKTVLMLAIKYCKQNSTESNYFPKFVLQQIENCYCMSSVQKIEKRILCGLKLELYSIKSVYIGLKNLI